MHVAVQLDVLVVVLRDGHLGILGFGIVVG
jgi:hypothetical protein